MDCLDGHLARATNQCSHFGDYYDHISDLVYHVILFTWVWRSGTLQDFGLISLLFLGLVLVVFVALCLQHLGCQEHHHEGTDSPSLEPFKKLCQRPEMIVWTRYFGCGTLVMFVYLFIWWFYRN
jgi:phosphatidylglycerophosphate synthase